MRFLILVVLGFAFAAAIPQNEERSRVRGIRRFSLATPALQAGRISENEVIIDLGEDKIAAPEGSEPRTRSRGTSLLRRGPARRLKGRPIIENLDPSAPVTEEAVQDVVDSGAVRGREGIRIRRPLKKITTIAITTTSQPITEEIAVESVTQAFVSGAAASPGDGTMMLKSEEGMLTEESKPIMKDKVMQDPAIQDPILDQEQGNESVVVEEPVKEIPINHKSELKSQGLPRPKKLRPIPIKLGRRGQGEADLRDAPAEIAPLENQEVKSVDSSPPSSHRFATRARPTLQARRRPINREANQQAELQQTAVEVTETLTEEAPKKTRTRARVPALSRNPLRSPSRRRISLQPEGAPEESLALISAVEDSATPIQEPETSFPDKNEFKILLTSPEIHNKVTTSTQKPVKIQARIRTSTLSSQTQPDEIQEDIRSEIDSSSSHIEAPVSEAVRKGRPQRINLDHIIPEPQTKIHVTDPIGSRFPTPRYGGSDLVYRGGEVHVTQIGTIEDTPTTEVRRILSGLGSKRRGLGRPKEPVKTITKTHDTKDITTDTASASSNKELQSNIDFIYDYYE